MSDDWLRQPEDLLRNHVETGEPLSEEEVEAVVAAGLTDSSAWENRGGGLYWHRETYPVENG